jgi:hypothetical protein
MTQIALINNIIVFFIAFFGTGIVFLVFLSDPKSKINQSFSFLTILYILWIVFGFFSNTAIQIESSLFFMKLRFAVVSLFFVASYFFPIYFPYEGKRYKKLDRIVLGTGVFFFFLSVFTNLIIKSVEVRDWGTEVIFGKGGFSFYLMVILLTLVIAFQLLRKYSKSPKEYRTRIQYFLVGVFIFISANFIFNVIFPLLGTYRYYQIGDYSAILFLSLTAFAILRKELFGIKVIVTGLLVILIGTLFFIDILAFTRVLWMQTIKSIILFFFLGLGYYLVKNVIKEIRQREDLERLASDLRKANTTKEQNIIEIERLKEGLEEKVRERTKELKEAKATLEVQIKARTKELRDLTGNLEKQVEEKTKELQVRVEELEKHHRVMVGRELKMIELKEEIERLKRGKK